MYDLSSVAMDHMSIFKLGDWKFLGNFTAVDLIAATTNALNGALLARRPDHCRNFTVVDIVFMALLGGIGGGVTRDVLVNEVPAAFTNPAYVALCLAAGIVGYLLPFKEGQLFREGPLPAVYPDVSGRALPAMPSFLASCQWRSRTGRPVGWPLQSGRQLGFIVTSGRIQLLLGRVSRHSQFRPVEPGAGGSGAAQLGQQQLAQRPLLVVPSDG